MRNFLILIFFSLYMNCLHAKTVSKLEKSIASFIFTSESAINKCRHIPSNIKLAESSIKIGFPTPNLEHDDLDFNVCIDKGKQEIKEKFDSAIKLIKKPEAKNALKKYYIASIVMIEGSLPGNDELKTNYDPRQQDLLSKLREAKTILKLEMNELGVDDLFMSDFLTKIN